MIDYKKHRERLETQRTLKASVGFPSEKSTTAHRNFIGHLLKDVEELLDKAEAHDKAVERVDELGMALAQIHASIATSTPIPDGMSILEFIAKVVNSKDSATADKVIN